MNTTELFPSSGTNTSTAPIQKCGWLEKEITTAYKMLVRYRPRYVVLTTASLSYYHQLPDHLPLPEASKSTPTPEGVESSTSKKKTCTEISLLSINESFLMQSAHKEPDIIHIQIANQTHVYRFRASSTEEALSWRMAIMMLLGKLSPTSTRVHFERGNTISFPVRPTHDEEQEIMTTLSKLCQQDDVINLLEDVTCSTADQAKFVSNLFFDSLAKLPSKERNIRSKEMGRSLVAWLEMGETSEGPLPTSSYAKERVSKIEVLTIWLRVALSREFLSSCKFDETVANADEGDLSSESSSMTHSTVKSRMRNVRRGSIIMPFRADTVECLFISSIIHSSSIKDNLLSIILKPVLRPIASVPENFMYPKATAAPINTAITNDGPIVPQTINGDSHADGTNTQGPRRGGLVKRSSKRLMGIVRGALGVQQTNTSNAGSHSEDRPPSIERNTGQAFANHYQFMNAKNGEELNHFGIEELTLLSPIELKRLEVRKRLIEVSSNITENMTMHANHHLFPIAISTIIRTIRDLIIHTPKDVMEFSTASASLKANDNGNSADEHSRHTSNSDLLNEEEAEHLRSRKRFEYGTYFTSCSALIFLRLICRAIISPDDYGVTEKLLDNVYDRVANNTTALPIRALPAMAILAHTLVLPEEPVEDKNEVKVIGQQVRKDHMERESVLGMFKIIDRLKVRVSHKDVSLLLAPSSTCIFPN